MSPRKMAGKPRSKLGSSQSFGSSPGKALLGSPAGGAAPNNLVPSDVISLKYTIDYPRVELHPFDTQKFKIFYADRKIDAQYDLNRCLEMRVSSRQARDLIALLIKCFSAQTYFMNSKIIASLPKSSFESTSQSQESNGRFEQKVFAVSDVLLELETVKKELYNQIAVSKQLAIDKRNLTQQVNQVEEEMQMTIESYKSVLTASE